MPTENFKYSAKYSAQLEKFNEKLKALEGELAKVAKENSEAITYLRQLASGLREQYNFQKSIEFENTAAIDDYISIAEELGRMLLEQGFHGYKKARIEKQIAVKLCTRFSAPQNLLMNEELMSASGVGAAIAFPFGIACGLLFASHIIATGVAFGMTMGGAALPVITACVFFKVNYWLQKQRVISNILEPLATNAQNVTGRKAKLLTDSTGSSVAKDQEIHHFFGSRESQKALDVLRKEIAVFHKELAARKLKNLELGAIYIGLRQVYLQQYNDFCHGRPLDAEYIKCCTAISKHFRAEASSLTSCTEKTFDLNRSCETLCSSFEADADKARTARNALTGILVAAVIAVGLGFITGGFSLIVFVAALVTFAVLFGGVSAMMATSKGSNVFNRDLQKGAVEKRATLAQNAKKLSKLWAGNQGKVPADLPSLRKGESENENGRFCLVEEVATCKL
jgi:hypothetical protein